ncbi:MAG TPA: heme NO-binding domain-containing protein [Ktedonosporobacter sp.]|jgi:hypothetical protein|nr:heme NO-binding domain-containing protein [Ktedonosporobacter sp.]
MHGLVLVTWENFLAERFGNSLLSAYRIALKEDPATAPLVSRVYKDEKLLKGVDMACKLTGMSADILLREYGHFFIVNGLTNHLCTYLLSQVKNGRELLLIMREAHAQMRRMPDGITPPLFLYEPIPGCSSNFALIYDSPRQLCPVLHGAIQGAMDRFGEKVYILESTCMQRGAAYCRFEIYYLAQRHRTPPQEPPEMQKKRQERLQLANIILFVLPDRRGLTLLEIRSILQTMQVAAQQLRLNIILEALLSLQYAGLVTSTANYPDDILANRRYWRVPTTGLV